MRENAFRARGRSIAQRDEKQWAKHTHHSTKRTEARWPLSVLPNAGRRGQTMTEHIKDRDERITCCKLQESQTTCCAACTENRQPSTGSVRTSAVSESSIRSLIHPREARFRGSQPKSCISQDATDVATEVAG